MNIKINLNRVSYRLPEPQDGCEYPLPWGKMNVTGAEVSGSVFRSRGGHWDWNLPEFAISGYGRYCPYVEFLFTGEISVINLPSSEGLKWLKLGAFGCRRGSRKWIFFRGDLIPTERMECEGWIDEIRPQLEQVEEKIEQGGLSLYRSTDPGLNFDGIQSRRKIFNHQFFGDCRVLWNWRVKTEWMVVVNDDLVRVVSPDHLDQPLILGAGTYFAYHPQLGNGQD